MKVQQAYTVILNYNKGLLKLHPMKNLTYLQYYNLIIKVKENPYLYVSAYKEARENLETEQFHKLQNEISQVA